MCHAGPLTLRLQQTTLSEHSGISQLLPLHAIPLDCVVEEALQRVLAVAGRGIRHILLAVRVVHQHALCRVVLPNAPELCGVLPQQPQWCIIADVLLHIPMLSLCP